MESIGSEESGASEDDWWDDKDIQQGEDDDDDDEEDDDEELEGIYEPVCVRLEKRSPIAILRILFELVYLTQFFILITNSIMKIL